MFDEIKNIKTHKRDLRNFGITFCVILIILSNFLFIKNKDSYQLVAYLGSAFLVIGLIAPIILKPIYLVWMIFAIILGWIMTRLILSLLFYIILSPIGLLMRLFGKDFLGLKLDSSYQSYWNERDKNIESTQDLEKQF